jgi:hypothetical protein
MATKTKKAFIIREFGDAGTEQRFAPSTAGKPETMPDIEEGAFANYEHAGLLRNPTDEDVKGAAPVADAKAAKTTA